MFKHILVPTDGTELSAESASAAIRFAKETKARVTGFYAAVDVRQDRQKFQRFLDTERELASELARRRKEVADRFLAAIELEAKEAEVPCQIKYITTDDPVHEAIIRAAKENACDLIFMATHGPFGIEGITAGSETKQVLSHCTIPVLVYRH
ncbi:MAG: universal stress protein [Burkholderiales bacterium]